MVALVEKMSPGRRRHPRSSPKGDRQAQGRPPEALRLQLPSPHQAFNLQLRFTKSRVDRDEVIEALQDIIHELRDGK